MFPLTFLFFYLCTTPSSSSCAKKLCPLPSWWRPHLAELMTTLFTCALVDALSQLACVAPSASSLLLAYTLDLMCHNISIANSVCHCHYHMCVCVCITTFCFLPLLYLVVFYFLALYLLGDLNSAMHCAACGQHNAAVNTSALVHHYYCCRILLYKIMLSFCSSSSLSCSLC